MTSCPSCISFLTYFSTQPTIFIGTCFNLNFPSWCIDMCSWDNKILEMKTKKEQIQRAINSFQNWKNCFLFGKKNSFSIKTLWKALFSYLNWPILINFISYLSILSTKKSERYSEVSKFRINFKRVVLKMDCLTFKGSKKKQNYFWMLYFVLVTKWLM